MLAASPRPTRHVRAPRAASTLSLLTTATAAAALALAPQTARALTNPFTETFATDNANWRRADALTGADFAVTGSTADGTGSISTTRSFSNDPVSTTQPPVLFNARSAFNSSGNNLFGDYLAGGVTTFSFDIRQNTPAALTAFVRFAGANNFPGATAIGLTPVQPNVWTTITISINPASPNFVSFEGTDFATVFGAGALNGNLGIQRLQLGVFVPQSLAFSTPTYTFEIDNLRIVPSPSTFIGAAFGILALTRRRRA
ncbi:hypothetical protein BH11PLA1_BH11PLA1_08620 [soil metagenome]